MATYKAEGVILRKQKFGEAGHIVTIFTKQFGKLKVVAKGSRRLKSRKSGSLELVNRCLFLIAKGRTLDLITEVAAVELYLPLKADLVRSVYTFQLLELVDRLTAEEQDNPDVYKLFLKTLKILSGFESNDWQKVDLVIASFSIKLLKILGFWEEDELENRFQITADSRRRLELLRTIPLEQITRLDAEVTTQRGIKKIIDHYTATILERDLKSQFLIQQVVKETDEI